MMTFMALLTKELRSRLRRERTIWLMVVYILLLGLTGWFLIKVAASPSSNNSLLSFSSLGPTLYYLLSILQLFLIIFITPAFTAAAVNGEKMRQTFDLLLCSRLSSFSLIAGKLAGGLTGALLLIISSVPLFSLLFLFGGVAPLQLLGVLLIYTATALLVGSIGLLFSTLLRRPALSTSISYLFNLLWLIAPVLFLLFWSRFSGSSSPSNEEANLILLWNPVAAIVSFEPMLSSSTSVHALGFSIPIWVGYSGISLAIACLALFVSTWLVRPISLQRFYRKGHTTPEKAQVGAFSKSHLTTAKNQ